jgi:ABC-2 type transport system permease protein
MKIFIIAWREFLATVATKGFLLGLLIPPVLIGIAAVLLPLLMNKESPSVAGHIAIIDRSGEVSARLVEAFAPEKLAQRRNQKMAAVVKEGTEKASEALGIDAGKTKAAVDEAQKLGAGGASPMMPMPGVAGAMPALPTLSVRVLDAQTDVETAKQEILKATGREQATDANAGEARLALIVVPSEAISRATAASTLNAQQEPTKQFPDYEIFVAPRLDVEVQDDIRDQASKAIIDARLEKAGLNAGEIRALIARPQASTKTVTKEGERKTNQAAAILVPGAFMMLIWISVFTSGQYLLAGTIEEKSNRVMEVLLSAASPTQLMLGKILGKGAVGALVMLLYGSAGILALIAATLSHLLDWNVVLLVAVYFVIAYMTIACLFAAVGAAVTEVTEAQSLLGPIMMILIIPMMLWMPILRNPNSGFATAVSFVPLVNPFVMVLRIAGSEPIPAWQIPVSIAVGILTVVVMVWLCAKIFRVGVLMYGKAPNFATLLKWIRMA